MGRWLRTATICSKSLDGTHALAGARDSSGKVPDQTGAVVGHANRRYL